jgi:dUTP pyrophosphatase
LKVNVKLFDGGVMPKMQRAGDACFDCYAKLNEDVTIAIGKREKIPLGFALELPTGYEALIRPRSGLASKGIDNALGTCDENYRGELCAIVINNSDKDFVVHKNDRICQLAIRKTYEIELNEVSELSETNRGSDGFGSSGI